jgi:thioredoxin 1
LARLAQYAKDSEIKRKGELLMRKAATVAILFGILLGARIVAYAEADNGKYAAIPVKDTVTMVDLGAHKCIPCKMMAPILKKLKKAYQGKAAIIFIDVWKDKSQAKKYGIRAIPTQIFFDRTGKEVYRHVGFMGEKAIIEQLEKMGVDQPSLKKG